MIYKFFTFCDFDQIKSEPDHDVPTKTVEVHFTSTVVILVVLLLVGSAIRDEQCLESTFTTHFF